MDKSEWLALTGYGILTVLAGFIDSRISKVMIGAFVAVAVFTHPDFLSKITGSF